MRHAVLGSFAVALMLGLGGPIRAEPPGADDPRGGLERLEEGLRRVLEGLMDEVRPLLERDILPMLDELGGLVDDLSHYQMPELLPNGDILIRRAPDAPPRGQTPSPPDIGADGGVEL